MMDIYLCNELLLHNVYDEYEFHTNYSLKK